jgi:pyruvate dehydrogenase E2 component (dihydrolipoamide acetyltransferase)
MITDIVMPNMGFDTQEARLIEWLKQPGDPLVRGEPVAVIESDKANVELESVASGILLEQRCAEGDDVKVGAVIARVGQASDMDSPAAQAPQAVSAAKAAEIIEASPIARRLAAEHQIDLADVQGSGPRGRVKRNDVEAFISAGSDAGTTRGEGIRALPKVRRAARKAGIDLTLIPATGHRNSITMDDLTAYQETAGATPTGPAPAYVAPDEAPADREESREVPISRVREIIGKRLGESKREAPHFYVTGEFDLEAALLRLQRFPDPQPGMNDLIQYLTVQTLQQVPELNATYQDGKLFEWHSINLAVAVARDDGLITPVIHGAERYSLTGLAAESREVIRRARDNRMHPQDLQGGSFTISNLGIVKQVDHFTAVINPPQVAILAVGTIKPQAVVVNGGLHVRHTVHMTLSGDHRVLDGVHLGRFMAAFQEQLDYFNKGY